MAMFNRYVTNYQRVRYWLSGNPNVSGPLASPCLASLPGDTSAVSVWCATTVGREVKEKVRFHGAKV
jgi:hypothetical protein